MSAPVPIADTAASPPSAAGGRFADVLVVIPALNEAEHLPDLLRQLIDETPGALIVVADGGSEDASPEIVQAFAAKHTDVRLLANPKRLQSAAVNLAAERFGQGRRWLVRVDAHCGYPHQFVATLVAAALQADAQSVVVPMITTGRGCFQRAAAAAQNSRLGTGGSAHRHVEGPGGYVDHGHHALFDLTAFQAAGGYDESFRANEDAEFDVRHAARGARIWLEPTAAIAYHPRRTLPALFRQYLAYGAGRARTVRRHRMKLKPRQAAPLLVAPAVTLALAAPWAPVLALPALMWAGLCLAYGAVLGAKARDGCKALSGVAAMTMHLAWSLGFWRERLTGGRA